MEQKNKGSCITFWMRGRRSAQPAPKMWCLTTKEQGIAGSEAPRPVRRRPNPAAGPRPAAGRPGNSKPLARARCRVPRRRSPARRPAALQLGNSPTSRRPTPPPKKDRRTVGPPNFPNFPNLLNLSGIPKYSARPSIGFTQVPPTSPSGFSWSSSWIAASSGFWHVPARSGRSVAGPWNRTGSNNSCC